MILDVVQYPDKMLDEISKAVERVGKEEKRLFEDMVETMHKYNGVGLAAVQVGILKRMLVIDIYNQKKPRIIKIANPEIISNKGIAGIEEGCLSVPKKRVKIDRANDVLVKGLNENNQQITLLLSGLEAIVLQHEIDHLNGKTIMDYIKC